MRKFLALAMSLILIGCSMPTKKDMVNMWVGRNITEAIDEYGPPSSTTVLPNGNTVYGWEQQYGSANAIKRGGCRKGLHVDNKGIIVDASQFSDSLLCK